MIVALAFLPLIGTEDPLRVPSCKPEIQLMLLQARCESEPNHAMFAANAVAELGHCRIVSGVRECRSIAGQALKSQKKNKSFQDIQDIPGHSDLHKAPNSLATQRFVMFLRVVYHFYLKSERFRKC